MKPWLLFLTWVSMASCASENETPFDVKAPPLCGNGRIDPNELCDGAKLAGETCFSITLGALPAGQLSCSPVCTFDTSLCRSDEAAGGSSGSGGGMGTGGGGMTGFGGGGMTGIGGMGPFMDSGPDALSIDATRLDAQGDAPARDAAGTSDASVDASARMPADSSVQQADATTIDADGSPADASLD